MNPPKQKTLPGLDIPHRLHRTHGLAGTRSSDNAFTDKSLPQHDHRARRDKETDRRQQRTEKVLHLRHNYLSL
jgi:hypothetical protein